MHRSGTSMVTRQLISFGMHFGRQLTSNMESSYFQALNRDLNTRAGGSWHNPEPVIQAMQSETFVNKQVALLEIELYQKAGLLSYFDFRRQRDMCLGKRKNGWGWKDPRNTITMPVWLRIFPQARLIHVIRNGIDVAISLHRRESTRPETSKHYSLECQDFTYCFHLWEQYLQAALDFRLLVASGHYLELKYEDMLSAPELELRLLIAFAGLSVSEEQLRQVASTVDRRRLDNSEYARPYQYVIPNLVDSPLMERYGYTYQV
jgi:hypothetical protein